MTVLHTIADRRVDQWVHGHEELPIRSVPATNRLQPVTGTWQFSALLSALSVQTHRPERRPVVPHSCHRRAGRIPEYLRHEQVRCAESQAADHDSRHTQGNATTTIWVGCLAPRNATCATRGTQPAFRHWADGRLLFDGRETSTRSSTRLQPRRKATIEPDIQLRLRGFPVVLQRFRKTESPECLPVPLATTKVPRRLGLLTRPSSSTPSRHSQ
jgi:hypothetical protein